MNVYGQEFAPKTKMGTYKSKVGKDGNITHLYEKVDQKKNQNKPLRNKNLRKKLQKFKLKNNLLKL